MNDINSQEKEILELCNLIKNIYSFFHIITKGKVPVFLGSSFAFIAPIIAATKLYGYPGTLGGIIAVGLVYGIVSAIIKLWGLKVIEKIFPSVVVGPVIMIIGLSLASVGVDMAKTDWLIALSVLTTAILIVIFAKGLFKLIPIFSIFPFLIRMSAFCLRPSLTRTPFFKIYFITTSCVSFSKHQKRLP